MSAFESILSSTHSSMTAVNQVAGPLTDMPVLSAKTVGCPTRIQLPLRRDRDKLAFTLEDVLTSEECEQIIRVAEGFGFGQAGLGSSGKQTVSAEFRDSSRIISEDPVLAGQILDRIRPHLPCVCRGRRLIGLNEQLKILRYHPGQKFAAHFDGRFCRPNTPNQTCLTLQLYLSQGHISGGSTRFIGQDASSGVSCLPKAGRALVFQHNILHEGAVVEDGVKYTIRTDVEYGGESGSARLQELVGLGGSRSEQRRASLLAFTSLIALVAVIWAFSSRVSRA